MTKPYCLQIPHKLYEAMLAHALSESPNECCGFLAGKVIDDQGIVSRRLPLENLADDPRTEYFAKPFAAHRAMRELGIEALAIYHSHPTAAPIPSRKDRERNWWGDAMVFLIVSLAGDRPSVRAWRLTATEATEAEWVVSDD